MAWFLVVVAGLLETGFAIFLKQSHGLTRVAPTVLFMIFALGSFGLLTAGPAPPGSRAGLRGVDRHRRRRNGHRRA